MDEKEKERALEDLKVIKRVMEIANIKKRLYRSPTERRISGVCGGLSEHYGMEPGLVRSIFVVFYLLGGAGLLIYVILRLAVPLREKTAEEVGMVTPVGDKSVGMILTGVFSRRRWLKQKRAEENKSGL